MLESINGNRYINANETIDQVIIQILSKENNQLDGIIHFINSQKGSNYIEITSSPFNKSCDPVNAIKYNDIENSFSSSNDNAFICFNFRDYRTIPTSYSEL